MADPVMVSDNHQKISDLKTTVIFVFGWLLFIGVPGNWMLDLLRHRDSWSVGNLIFPLIWGPLTLFLGIAALTGLRKKPTIFGYLSLIANGVVFCLSLMVVGLPWFAALGSFIFCLSFYWLARAIGGLIHGKIEKSASPRLVLLTLGVLTYLILLISRWLITK